MKDFYFICFIFCFRLQNTCSIYVNFDNYLKTICNDKNLVIKTIILTQFYNKQIPVNQQNYSKNSLSKFQSNCLIIKPSNFNFSDLNIFLQTNQNIQFVFDLTYIKNFTNELLNYYLAKINTIFNICQQCLPFHLLFCTFTNIYKLTKLIYSTLPKYFQCVFITFNVYNKSEMSKFYLNPVLNGCHFYNGIFIPNSEIDYRKLNIPYHKCNLNNSLITVSVNDVSFFIH